MIDIKFIDSWSNEYDKRYLKRERQLEEKIKSQLKKLFPKGKVEYLTRDILYAIVYWKARRIRNKVLKNREEFVKETTKHCFSSLDEQFMIEGLTILKGVGYRVATAILNFCFPSKYTIMDYRAWWTLQERGYLPKSDKIKDDFEHWQKYLKVCREISNHCRCSLRKLDKALWKYSENNQK